MTTRAVESQPRRAIVDATNGHATEVVAGLGLLVRCVLMLRKEGFSRIAAVVPREEIEAAREALREAFEWRAIADPIDIVGSLSELAFTAGEEVLLWPCELLADPVLIRRLRDASLEGIDVCRAVGPTLSQPIGPLVARAAWLGSGAEVAARTIEAGDLWFARITLPGGRGYAVKKLFDACRKSVDGMVSRHLNRHVSIAISKQIVDTSITPNQVSAVTFALGMLGAFLVSRGGYWPIVAGAFFLQWNSILDGVDGELARVRYQHSRLGQWVDTISDDVTNVIFWGALGFGARTLPTVGPFLAWCGAVASVSNALVAAIYYVELVSVGSGDVYDIQWSVDQKPAIRFQDKLLVFLRYLLKKDFFILFCFVLALFGVLPYALPVLAVGAIGTFIAAAGRAVKVLRARRAA